MKRVTGLEFILPLWSLEWLKTLVFQGVFHSLFVFNPKRQKYNQCIVTEFTASRILFKIQMWLSLGCFFYLQQVKETVDSHPKLSPRRTGEPVAYLHWLMACWFLLWSWLNYQVGFQQAYPITAASRKQCATVYHLARIEFGKNLPDLETLVLSTTTISSFCVF